MPPGEQMQKVATGFFDAMKSQPMALALAVMNIALLVILWYVASSAHDTQIRNMDYQKELNQLLAKCVLPDKKE